MESPRGCRQNRVVAALEAAAAVQQPAPHRRDKKNGEEEDRDKKKAWEGAIRRSDGVRIFTQGRGRFVNC